jgi:hypothetical protein
VDRRDHGLGAILDDVDHLGQHGLHLPGRAELADVGSGEEGLAVAMDDDRFHIIVRVGLADRPHQPFAHRQAERVDRGIVRRDDQHVTLLASRNRVHLLSSLCPDGQAVVRP